MKPVYDVQVSERDSWGIPRLRTFGTTTSKHHVGVMVADIKNLSRVRRLCRVLQDGRVLSDNEIYEMR